MRSRPATRRAAAAAPLLALLLLAAPARADALRGTVGAVEESAVAVDVRFDRGDARVVVRRTLTNGDERDDQAVLDVEAPKGGVAVGLRTLATGGAWIDGALMEAERAEKRYRELTGFGLARARDPVILAWAGQGALTLQAFPVPAGGTKVVEYTLRVPAEWSGGAWHVVLPAMATGGVVAQAVVRPASAEDALAVDGRAVEAPARVALDHATDVSLAPRGQPRLAAGLAVAPAGPSRFVVHAQVEAAARLSEVPRGAWVVVLLDASRSVDDAALTAELAAARAYVSWLPDARVALLAFDRAPRPLAPAFLDARQAASVLASARIARRNGSHLDAALAEAARLLAAAPAGAPRRIVALTDLRMRGSLTPEGARDVLAGSGAILHLASVSAGEPSLSRDDDAAWAALPRATGGVLWDASATTDPADDAPMRRVFEEWARPLRVDRLAVTLHGAAGQSLDATTLDEGAGLDDARITTTAPDGLRLDGELWSRPVHLAAVPSEDAAAAWSALVFGTSLVSELTPAEMRSLAWRGRAVSPVTSYLAVEPGARPSTSGVPELLSGIGSSFGSHSIGCGCRVGYGSRRTIDVPGLLATAIAPAWRRCAPGVARGRVTIETTSREVVDVPRATVDGAGGGTLAECLGEAAWSIDVPEELAQISGTWQVEL
jgi:hypothetical protein